jgi:hypothetical protein
MTVTEAYISKISPFSVTADGPFTPDRFSLYLSIAKEQLDREASRLSPELYDYAHALLICHYYVVGRGGAGIKSQTLGGLSFTRASDVDEYLAEYRSILESNAAPDAPAAFDGEAERADASMPAFELDRSGGY